MARLAIASSPAVLFVGPPGTGKSELVRQVVRDAQSNPSAYGLASPIKEPTWETPEESWTALDVLGGETLSGSSGDLVFRPGCLLNAIREDRWLVLDETNRADLDRIFGGALTWLAAAPGQSVAVGRVSNAASSGKVLLTWGADPECQVVNEQGLGDSSFKTGDIDFRAGTDWRLLGTYNALDAQRVFRFGHALGRRFSRVPVPPLSTADFSALVADPLWAFDTPLQTALAGLYAAHATGPATSMGPALFLRIGRHVAAGQSEAGYSPSDFRDLLCEAYTVNIGAWLATMEPADLTHLQAELARTGTLDDAEWEWVMEMSQHLG